jgi:hypothetical protein
MAASPPPPKERNSASKARSSSERAATLAIGADTEDRCIGAGVQVQFLNKKTHIRKLGSGVVWAKWALVRMLSTEMR